MDWFLVVVSVSVGMVLVSGCVMASRPTHHPHKDGWSDSGEEDKANAS